MRAKKYRATSKTPDTGQSSGVQQEIDNFLRALRSYPESFAHDPRLSFEQHMVRVASATASGRENHTH
ncbi:MAG: hypothetical protein WB952_20065 [Terriglobales bacterium]